MPNRDNQELCAGLNPNMTPEQISTFLKRLADDMKEQGNKNWNLLGQLISPTLSEENRRDILLDLIFVEIIRSVQWRTLHFLAYGTYPTEDADSTRI